MEHYNQVDHNYLNLINRSSTFWKIRLELLDHWENTIDAIERDIDNGNSGSISCNNEQGTHKSCTITLTNIDEKYTPDENNPFWFNRKFRLYIGIQDDKKIKKRIEDFYWAGKRTIFDGDTYWFAKGVFITQSVQCDSVNKIVTISGVDKYAQLDGTLNVLQADEMETVFRIGSNVKRVVTDTLMLNIGNGLPLDPIEPIIDTETANQTLYKEFTLSAGQYYGDFLNELATSFGCEIFYDNIGRLTIRRSFTDDVAYWNAFKAPSHEFENGKQGYIEPQESANLNGVNKIIVQTENIETPNASYTAINHNPQSPLCYDKIGGRTLPENGGVITINAGDLYQDDRTAEYMVMKRCKDYAEYRLMKETCTALEISFNCPMYPHINEGDIITITDRDFKLDHDTFIVNSITFNLGDLTTQMQVVNTQYLNTDINATADVIARGINKPVTIEYKIVGGTGVFPSPTELPTGTVTFITTSGYDTENHFITFYKNDAHPEYYETTTWVNTYDGSTCPVGYETYNPGFDSILFPIWENVEDKILRIEVKDCNEGTLSLRTIDRAANSQTKRREVLERVKAGTRYYYYYGRGQSNDVVSIPTDGDLTLEHVLLDYPTEQYYYDAVRNIANLIIQCSSSVNNGVGYSVKLPDVLTSYSAFYDFTWDNLNYTNFTFGRQIENLRIKSFFVSASNLQEFNFNNNNVMTIDFVVVSTYGENMLAACPNLANLSADNKIIFHRDYPYSGNKKMTVGGASSLPNMNFPNGIQMEYTNFFNNCSTNETRSICLGNKTINENSGCSFNNSDIFASITANNVDFVINDISVDQSAFLDGASIKSLTITGLVTVASTSNTMAHFLLGTNITNSTSLSIGNTFLIGFGGLCMVTLRGIEQLSFMKKVLFQQVTSNSNLTFIVGCSNMTRINFYDEVSFGLDVNASITFMCGNTLLTDVYFYNSSMVLPSSATAFDANNADFKIHGIAGSQVQTIANNRGIPFVAITDAELAEAGL